MWFAIGFGAACILGAYAYSSVAVWMIFAALLISTLFLVTARFWKTLRIPAMVMFSFAVGIGWFLLFDNQYLADAREYDGKTLNTVVTVSDYSYDTDYGCAVTGVVTISGKDYPVLVYLDGTVNLKPGDQFGGNMRFRFTSEGGTKEPTYHRSEGIYLLAYQVDEIFVSEAKQTALKYYPVLWRKEILNRIDLVFPAQEASFVKALLLGDRSGIDYETNTAFKISGISHIVAVSGLHVSILFAVLYLFTGRRKVLSFLLGAPVLLLFAAMAGFTPSITRACIMQFLMLLAMLTDREYDPPTALSFAALMMLAANPMVITSISFQLSVGCMIGIFLFYQKVHDWFLDSKRLGSAKGKGMVPKLKRWFVSSISISLSASIVTTPIVAYHFGTISLVGLVTNLLVVWLISYIFYGAVIALLISLTGIYVGKIAAFLVVLPIRLVISLAKTISSFPLAAVYTVSPYIVVWLIGTYVLLVVFLILRSKPVIVYGCCVTLGLCAALVASSVEPMLDNSRMTMLDVGQGQCILLQSEGRTFLVDCGGDNAATTADLAAETLLSQGISRLDGLILTHYDYDHAGGAAYLLSRIPTDSVYLPYLDDPDGVTQNIRKYCPESSVIVEEDLSFTYGSSRITLFASEIYKSGNECSMSVLFQTEKCDILITGDRGVLGEMLLLRRIDLPDLDVLVAGHHGSADSTGEDLLTQTKPEIVLISVDKNNPYGHPADALLKRLTEHGCAVYRTDQNGTILYRR